MTKETLTWRKKWLFFLSARAVVTYLGIAVIGLAFVFGLHWSLLLTVFGLVGVIWVSLAVLDHPNRLIGSKNISPFVLGFVRFLNAWSIFVLFGIYLILVILGYSLLYCGFSAADCWDLTGNNAAHKKPDSLYFSVVTLSTLGYGDFAPIGACRKIAMAQSLTGFLGMPVLTGLILFALTRQSNANS